MGQWVGWVLGQWVMGLGYDGSDGSWVTNGDPWSTLYHTVGVKQWGLFQRGAGATIDLASNSVCDRFFSKRGEPFRQEKGHVETD